MRKIICMVIIMTTTFGFSQEESKVKSNITKISRFDVFVKWNQAKFRWDQSVPIFKYPMRVEAIFRYNRAEAFVGMTFPLDEKFYLTTQVGTSYKYDENNWDPLLRASLRSNFRWGIIRINYGSHWIDDHGVSSSTMLNIVGPLFRIGVATHNKYIGPRTEAKFLIGKKKKRSVRFHIAYFPTEGRFDYGLRLRFGEWFPKIDQKFKKIEDDINSFYKKSK